MPFVKVIKNKAYFKRYQVKYRRRREGKTDYRARRQMVLQDKTKYDSPKYRLVVRRSNKDIIAQIVQAKMRGDDVFCAAYAHELPRYGINFGLTNYAAAYATGLLLARRTLDKVGLAGKFEGVKAADGTYKECRVKGGDVEGEGRFPFKAILDLGLARTTTGARIFGVLKGAVDGGLAVPHSENRFPGFKKGALDAKAHRERIFGTHVAKYYSKLFVAPKEKADSFVPYTGNQFKKLAQLPEFKIDAKPVAGKVEELYKKAHAAIRANPQAKKTEKKAVQKKDYRKGKRMNRPERRRAAKAKIATLRKKLGK